MELCGDNKVVVIDFFILFVIEEDWEIEFLFFILVVKVVFIVEEVIYYINMYGFMYFEVIIIENEENVSKFFIFVDVVVFYYNVLICFIDGFEFGFGVEIGISI